LGHLPQGIILAELPEPNIYQLPDNCRNLKIVPPLLFVYGRKERAWLRTLQRLEKKSIACHPVRSEGSAFLRDTKETADSSGELGPSE
jgi:hypothetical protein